MLFPSDIHLQPANMSQHNQTHGRSFQAAFAGSRRLRRRHVVSLRIRNTIYGRWWRPGHGDANGLLAWYAHPTKPKNSLCLLYRLFHFSVFFSSFPIFWEHGSEFGVNASSLLSHVVQEGCNTAHLGRSSPDLVHIRARALTVALSNTLSASLLFAVLDRHWRLAPSALLCLGHVAGR